VILSLDRNVMLLRNVLLTVGRETGLSSRKSTCLRSNGC